MSDILITLRARWPHLSYDELGLVLWECSAWPCCGTEIAIDQVAEALAVDGTVAGALAWADAQWRVGVELSKRTMEISA